MKIIVYMIGKIAIKRHEKVKERSESEFFIGLFNLIVNFLGAIAFFLPAIDLMGSFFEMEYDVNKVFIFTFFFVPMNIVEYFFLYRNDKWKDVYEEVALWSKDKRKRHMTIVSIVTVVLLFLSFL